MRINTIIVVVSLFVIFFLIPRSDAVVTITTDESLLDTFLNLNDVLETTFAGQGGQCVQVNAGETGLVFGNCSNATGGGGGGDITAVLGDEWITNGSVTGAVNLIFNDTLLNETIDDRLINPLFELSNDWITNITTSGINTTSLILQEQFFTPQNYFAWNLHDDGSNLILNASSVAGNNYFGIETDGAFLQLYSNPNPSIDHLMFTVTETQGASTFLNFYEGGTGHNRLWDSGSMRIGGGASRFCSNLTSDVDCDTPLTGADLVVQDDIWAGGKLFSSDWTNVSITESQISDLTHTTDTDTNASTACSGDEVLLGNGSCQSGSDFGGNPFDQDLNTTDDVTFNKVTLQSSAGSWDTDEFIVNSTNTFFQRILSCDADNEKLETDATGDLVCGGNPAGSDTNASTACSGDQVLLGNGSCQSSSDFFDDTDTDTTYSHLSNFTNDILSHLSNLTDDILWTAGFNSTGDGRWSGGGNASWNESYADTLYAGIEWGYNQTYSGSTFNATYDNFAYNQTELQSASITIGDNSGDVDVNFDGATFDGLFTWDNVNALFEYKDNMRLNSTFNFFFGNDGNSFITYSSTLGGIGIFDDTIMELDAGIVFMDNDVLNVTGNITQGTYRTYNNGTCTINQRGNNRWGVCG